jgi:hypothetical protein
MRVEIGKDSSHNLRLRVFERQTRRPTEDCPVGKRLDHVRHNEHHFVEIATRSQFGRPRCNRQAKGAVKAHSKILGPARPVRNLRHQQFIKFWVDRVGVDHRLNHGSNKVVDRRCSMFEELGLDQAINFFDVALVQSYKDRVFIGKVLVDRTDAYARHLGHTVRRYRIGSLAL